MEKLEGAARAIIDSNLYMTLGTADPRWEAVGVTRLLRSEGYVEVLWFSSPEATHSRNPAGRSRS